MSFAAPRVNGILIAAQTGHFLLKEAVTSPLRRRRSCPSCGRRGHWSFVLSWDAYIRAVDHVAPLRYSSTPYHAHHVEARLHVPARFLVSKGKSQPRPRRYSDPAQWAFEPLRAELHALGFATWSENVPTQQGDPSKTAEDDVAFIRAAVESYVARGQDVVMCGWSMAAWSGPAATEGLLRSPGQSTSKGKGAVVGLVYMACVIPERQGMNAEEIMGRWGGAGGAWYDPKDLVECGMEYVSLLAALAPS